MLKQKTITSRRIRFSLLLLNRLLSFVERIGFRLGDFDLKRLVQRAQRKARLTDFGLDDYQQPLNRLLASMQKKKFSPVARLYLQGEIERSLVNRLQIQEYVHRHPEVVEQPIDKPVFIVGFPRTGTTALQNMLDRLEGFRTLRLWEMQNPATPNRKSAIWATRFAASMLHFSSPEQKYIHNIGAQLPDECWRLLQNSFTTLVLPSACDLVDMVDWLYQVDMVPSYAYYKRQLQILLHQQASSKSQLVLKCPEHMWHLSALFEVFPDAKLIWTHRDPVKSIPSYASLLSLSQRSLFGEYAPKQIGKSVTDIYRVGIDRALAYRKTSSVENQILDIHCRQIAQTPLQVMEVVCDFVGHSFVEAERERVNKWLTAKISEKNGSHQYEMSEFDLNKEQINKDYHPEPNPFDDAPNLNQEDYVPASQSPAPS